jgi:hypothetical protein
VTTSEYHDVRERLIAQEMRRKRDPQDRRPQLRVPSRPGDATDDTKDERPTIKRRDFED